jgi:hypothetical protein
MISNSSVMAFLAEYVGWQRISVLREKMATLYAACTTCQVARKRWTELNRSAHNNHLRGAAMAAMLTPTD